MLKSIFPLLAIFVTCSCNNAGKETENTGPDSTDDKQYNAEQLVSPADSLSAEPYLFTDDHGMVYLSWIEKRNDSSWLKFSTLNNDQWSAPVTIRSGNNWFVNWADYPQLATDGGNNMVAHFLERSDTGKYTYDVKLVTSGDQGKSWNEPVILHDDGKKAEHGFVSIVPYKDNYFISWLDGRNTAMESNDGPHDGGHHGQMTIRGAIVDKKGIKTNEWELDERVCDCCQTSVAITSNGPIVVYRDRTANEIRDISIVRWVDDKWTKPAPVHPDNWKIEGCPVNGPKAAAIGNTLAVAWFSSPAKKAQVNIVFSSDGGASFDAPIRIDEGAGIGRVDIEMLDEKSAMVSWMEGPVIRAVKVYKDGKKESSMVIANSSEGRSSGCPQLEKAGNHFIFAWTDSKEKKVKVARLLASSR